MKQVIINSFVKTYNENVWTNEVIKKLSRLTKILINRYKIDPYTL